MIDPLIVIPDAVALVLCAIAAVTDLRHLRIPNRLTVAGFACGLILNPTFGFVSDGPAGAMQWLVAAVLGAALGLVVFGLPAALDMVGMGDVKLIAAIGGLIRWPFALSLVLYIALAGGAIALVHATLHGRVGAVGRNMRSLGTTHKTALHRMPYGLAIAIGCAWAVTSHLMSVLGFVVTDLNALEARLRARGVAFNHGIVRPTGNPLRTFAVRDNADNVVQLFGR
jgi:Flp pilus assembly protein protease CpaA